MDRLARSILLVLSVIILTYAKFEVIKLKFNPSYWVNTLSTTRKMTTFAVSKCSLDAGYVKSEASGI